MLRNTILGLGGVSLGSTPIAAKCTPTGTKLCRNVPAIVTRKDNNDN